MAAWKILATVTAGCVLTACITKSSGGGGTPEIDSGFSEDGGMTSDSAASGDTGAGTDSGKSGDSGGPGVDGGDGGSGDGGASCPGSSVDGGGLAYTGDVFLSRVSLPTPVRYEALTQIEATSMEPPSGCGGMLVGACCYENTPADAGLPTFVSAGDIVISDATGTLATLTFPGYAATSVSDTTLTWAGGTMLTVTAAGATVGAFTATVTAPGVLAGVTPAFSAPLTISRSADMVVSWTPGKRPCSKVTVGVTQGLLQAHIGCVVDDSAGTVTIPATLLGMFTATTGTAVIERIEGTHVLASNADIGVGVVNVETTTTTYTP